MPIVRLDKVSLSFGLKPLLDNVNLQLRRGERVCLLGRNGEGKSSLLQIISQESRARQRRGLGAARCAGRESRPGGIVRQRCRGPRRGPGRCAAERRPDDEWQAELQADQVISRLELDGTMRR